MQVGISYNNRRYNYWVDKNGKTLLPIGQTRGFCSSSLCNTRGLAVYIIIDIYKVFYLVTGISVKHGMIFSPFIVRG